MFVMWLASLRVKNKLKKRLVNLQVEEEGNEVAVQPVHMLRRLMDFIQVEKKLRRMVGIHSV
jgi:hypothetical protein